MPKIPRKRPDSAHAWCQAGCQCDRCDETCESRGLHAHARTDARPTFHPTNRGDSAMLRRLRLRRKARMLTPEEAARELRVHAHGGSTDLPWMLALAERADLPRWIAPLRDGHRIKTSVFDVRLLEPADDELVHAVDEVFKETS